MRFYNKFEIILTSKSISVFRVKFSCSEVFSLSWVKEDSDASSISCTSAFLILLMDSNRGGCSIRRFRIG